jgi:hypothetical protein
VLGSFCVEGDFAQEVVRGQPSASASASSDPLAQRGRAVDARAAAITAPGDAPELVIDWKDPDDAGEGAARAPLAGVGVKRRVDEHAFDVVGLAAGC